MSVGDDVTLMRGAGTFCVRRGATPAARVLARLMRLPRAGARVPVSLVVTRAEGEKQK